MSSDHQPPKYNPKFWPGGIPEHIKSHSEPIPWEDLMEVCKGWQLFIKENYIPFKIWPATSREKVGPEEANYEVTHRRALISQWASFPQETRDAYQSRAPPFNRNVPFTVVTWYPPAAIQPRSKMYGHYDDDAKGGGFFQCIASLSSPRNQALWTKLRILLNMDSSEGKITFCTDDISVVNANPESAIADTEPVLTVANFQMWKNVEPAWWHGMAMTNLGTVVFLNDRPILLADQEALDTGRVLLCEFENNGTVREEASIRVRAMNLANACIFLKDGKGVEFCLEGVIAKGELLNGPLKMELPILDILTDVDEQSILHLDGDFDDFAEHIEAVAPGYLEMEEESGGMVYNYNHERFAVSDKDYYW